MSLQIGNDKIEEIYYGSDKIKEVYYGSELVYSSKKEYQVGDLYENYGVVYYIDSSYYYVVGFQQALYDEVWLEYEEDTPIPNKTVSPASIDFNGKDYTDILMANYGSDAVAAYVAHIHSDKNNHPVGTYYLPALGELSQLLITSTMAIINPKIIAAGGQPIEEWTDYWSSSEADIYHSYIAGNNGSSVYRYQEFKAYYYAYVRPITKFLK